MRNQSKKIVLWDVGYEDTAYVYLHSHILFLKYSLYNNNIFSNAVSKYIQSMLNILIFSGFEDLNLW